jgi:hypothetical protein
MESLFMNNATKVEPLFPRELLNAPTSERLRYFKEKAIVTHPRMDEVVDEILEAVGSMCDQNLVLLVGPSGVGKTEALKEAVRRAVVERELEAQSKAHMVPAIFIEADAPDRGNFDWRVFYETGLAELGVPLIGSTLPYVPRIAHDQVIETLAVEDNHRSPTASALRGRFRNTLRHRETALVGVDEAVNLLQVRSTRNKQNRKDLLLAAGSSVRSLVNKATATIVLAGAFDFYDLASSTAQLARRSYIVYFQEYGKSAEDMEGFSRALLGLFAHLPIKHALDPGELAAELFIQSLGCVGVVKTILQRALMKALNRKKPLDPNILRSCYYPKSKLDVMRQEMFQGGANVRELLKASEFNEWLAKPPAKPADGKPKQVARSSARRNKPFEKRPSRRWRQSS